MNYLNIELLSETCLASGYGFGSIIDTDSTYDEYGLPIFPAKRFKGLLREAMNEYLKWDANDFTIEMMNAWLGCAHDQQGSIILWNGELEEAAALKQILQNEKGINRDDVIEHYTKVRKQTAIDDDSGVALDGSLRSIRCLNKGLRFRMKIDGVGNDAVLKKICKLIQYAGLNRNRGLGRIKVDYVIQEKATPSLAHPLSLKHVGNDVTVGKRCIRMLWKSETPLLVTSNNATQSEGYVAGSAFLGYFANAYLKKHQLREADQTFYQLFFSGKVKFTNAYPSSINMETTVPVGANIHKYKIIKSPEKAIVDIAQRSIDEEKAASKHLSNHFMSVQGTPRFIEPKVEMHFHHQRGEVSDDERLFSYEAMLADQYFVSEIEYDITYEKEVTNWLENLHYVTVGKSTNSQYGKLALLKSSIITIQEEDENQIFETGDCILMQLTSDLVFIDPTTGNYTNDAKALIHALEDVFQNYRIKDCFMKYSTYSGFNGKWKMPKEQIPCFGKGTVFVCEVVNDCFYNDEWFGEKNAEGYGKIQFRKIESSDSKEYPYQALELTSLNDADDSVLDKIRLQKLEYRVMENVRRLFNPGKVISNHALHRAYDHLYTNQTAIGDANQMFTDSKNQRAFERIQKKAFANLEDSLLPFQENKNKEERTDFVLDEESIRKVKRLTTIAILEKMMEGDKENATN